MNKGLKDLEINAFLELLTKANLYQLRYMLNQLNIEINKREAREK